MDMHMHRWLKLDLSFLVSVCIGCPCFDHCRWSFRIHPIFTLHQVH